MTSLNFPQWRDKALAGLAAIIVGGGVTWASWVTMAIVARPTLAQVEKQIKTEHPVTAEDKGRLEERINNMQSLERSLAEVIAGNTEAINELRIEIARLRMQQDEAARR